ncbi:membrane protein of ER body-like protein [Dorcoceras hygrometricum]|uniref:Membrane protein of ER body-like protein n=1 Tax=Dorcoceras hygrometricum TaxID=472368 RepID=A0A2Z7C2E5_9LAMI|nr:membrane protein of ER body-like protein [Dorcoceras hygrometricum]
MEKEEQEWEQGELEEEQEEEESSLQARKSRPVNETKSTVSDTVETEKNNGTSESNGHEIQSNDAANGSKDFESTLENGEGEDEVDGVVESQEEISDELQRTDGLVFFDKDEGIWKCRICSWIYGNGSACVDHMQNHNGQLHKLMNEKTLSNESGGNELTSPIPRDQQIIENSGHNELDIFSHEFDVLHNSTSAVNGGSEGHHNDDTSSYSNHQHNGIREDDGLYNTDLKSSGEIESEEVYVVPGDELEVTETDVERVLQKQTTHDLYCPNCNSCITQRVILRKRKRGIRLSAQDIKRNKLEAVADSKLHVNSSQVSSTVVHETDYVGVDTSTLVATNDTEHDREPELFRCLSCFSFFFPTGNGFKLFRIFEGKKVKVDIQDAQVPSTKKNWFTSIITFNKQEKAVPREPTTEHLEADASEHLLGRKSGKVAQMNHGTNLSTKTPSKGPFLTSEQSSEDDSSSSKGGMDLLISSNQEFLTFEKPKDGQIPDQKIQISKDGEGIHIMATPVSVLNDVDGSMGISLALPDGDQHVEATVVTESVENKKENFQNSKDGCVHPTEVSEHIVTKTKFEFHAGEALKIDDIPSVKDASTVRGKDTIITIDAQPVGSSQTGQNVVYPEETKSTLHSAPQATVADAEGTEVRNEFEIEVVKSIVYGGLAESIASLSVISSAAGGGAATLNVLALGVASLVGGFFIIVNNLWELRNECIEQAFDNNVSPEIEHRDRYKQLLGRKENFVLHAIISTLSYIIFGLVAPVTYGFSFRKSDDKEFKLIVVVASSLLCICGLALGRAYVRRPPKPYVKSVVTFVILGFMASGVSYVAGVLVERILDKLGLFHPSSGANLLLPYMQTVPSHSGWTSY